VIAFISLKPPPLLIGDYRKATSPADRPLRSLRFPVIGQQLALHYGVK
jgi:hypothetical protein